jgi:hypothetical protein
MSKQSFIYIMSIEGNLAYESSLAKKRMKVLEAH